jgi:hypothetical protein
MMKKGLTCFVMLMLPAAVHANEVGWLTDYGAALQAARTTSRPLLLVISREGAVPNSEVQPGSEPVAESPLESYVLCRIDAKSSYGKRVAEAFRVTEFPHAVIIDNTTKKILYSKAGQFSDQAWQATLAKYQSVPVVFDVTATPSYSSTQYTPSRTTGVSPTTRRYAQRSTYRRPVVCNT